MDHHIFECSTIQSFGIIDVYEILRDTVRFRNHLRPRDTAGYKMTVSHSRCELFYIQISRRECVWNYESNMRYVCVHFSKSNEFTSLHELVHNRSRMYSHIYARVYVLQYSYDECVSPFECRSSMHNAVLFYMHRNWFAPDTDLAIEWRVSMHSPRSSRSSSSLHPHLVPALCRVRVDHANPLGLIWFVLSYHLSYHALWYLFSRRIRYPDDCQDYVQHILKIHRCVDYCVLFKINSVYNSLSFSLFFTD